MKALTDLHAIQLKLTRIETEIKERRSSVRRKARPDMQFQNQRLRSGNQGDVSDGTLEPPGTGVGKAN
jgi:hypothetical protein